MLELSSTAFSFIPGQTSPFLAYVKAGLGLSWDEGDFTQSAMMDEAAFDRNRELMESILSLYQEIFMHCTDMDNAWSIHFSVLCKQTEQESRSARSDYGYILDLLRKLQKNSDQGDGSSGIDDAYLKRQLNAMKATKRQMAEQMAEHSRSLLNAIKTFNDRSAVDEDCVNSLRKQFESPYTGLDLFIPGTVFSVERVHADLQKLHDHKSNVSGTTQPTVTSIELTLAAWSAFVDDLRDLSVDEAEFENNYDDLISKLDLERIVESREELARRVQSFTS